ncbi:MAG: hypothetical protein F6K00_19075 [Leptolyngbya sp. SIOISBB]|nr:hypothetical protein [Leptolyngbya sp. SIOISBB]
MMHILVVNSDVEIRHHLYQLLDPKQYDITFWDQNPHALDLTHFSEPLLIIGDWKQVIATGCLSTWQAFKVQPGTPPHLLSHVDSPRWSH